MGKYLQLNIPVQCHENWNEMTPDKEGRFCFNCNKTVVDFSTMTDQEVLSYFKNATGNACGRFRDDQLNKNYALGPEKKLNWFKYFLQVLIPTLLFTTKTYSQGGVSMKLNVCTSPVKKDTKEKLLASSLTSKPTILKISGKVSNEKGEILEGANISVKGTDDIIETDKDGIFSLNLSNHFPMVLVASYAGYESKELSIDEKMSIYPVSIQLKERSMQEVVVTAENYASGRLGGISYGVVITGFDRVKQKIADSFNLSSPKIYPNPLRKSSLLTIEFSTKLSGEYSVLLTDLNGRHIKIEQFNAQVGRIQKQFRLTQGMAAGGYFVSLIDPKGKRVTSQKVIVLE